MDFRRFAQLVRRLAVALAVPLVGCGGGVGDGGGVLLPGDLAAVGATGATPMGLKFSRPPRIADIEIDQERRPALVTVPGSWSWRGRIPLGGRLRVGVQALPDPAAATTRLAAEVAVRQNGEREVLEATAWRSGSPRRWLDLNADLGRWEGREVEVEFRSVVEPAPADPEADAVAWGPVAVVAPAEPASLTERPPNVIVIVVDTLRADHLTAYGYPRETSPEVDRWLARPGAVVEQAFSQAPWTLPSAVSYLTGRWPGDLLGGSLASFAVPEGVPTLAERLEALGYATAGFYANPTLHAGNGFARGFQTFFTPPPVLDSMRRHADDVGGRARAWLAAHQWRRPFFLYLHYIDPHDPYFAPDLVGGRSPFYPRYDGPIDGGWVHGIYLGQIPLTDPDRDVAHLTALYDSEIRNVDRDLGLLMTALDQDVLGETLIVLTSDHGEELYDHGGWKHGETLYQELIHVPLIVRWDGRVPAGRRVGGTVRLVDLVPTLMAAAGAPAPGAGESAWDGVDLLPALTGAGTLPRRPAFAEHLASGPLRAAAVLDGWKLALFNAAEPFTATDETQAFLWRRDLARLARAGLYDLAADPGERVNRIGDAGSRRELVAALDAVVAERLDRRLPGVRVATGALVPGTELSVTVDFAEPPTAWQPLFLGPDDRVVLAGRRLTLRLVGEATAKGVRVEGSVGGLTAVTATLEGEPLPPGRIGVGARSWAGSAVDLAGLAVPAPPPADGPAVRIWSPAGGLPAPADENDETRKRLQALGYLQ